MAPYIWRAIFATIFAFVKNGLTRLRLFYYQWEAFGLGKHFYSGEGIWTPGYAEVDSILRGVQERQSAFACVHAPVPDLFPSSIVVFLPNTSTAPSDSEWAAIRFAMHQFVFDKMPERLPQIPGKIQEAWPNLQLSDLNDAALLGKVVTKSVFFVLFGIWLEDAECDILSQWVTVAKYAIFPRSVQRFLFNFLINKTKKLRIDTVHIIERLNLQQVFVDMNDSLPEKYKRPTVAKLCDEVMFILAFAGMNGTTACATSCVAFLQTKFPAESDINRIDFGRYSTPELMLEAYKKDPANYIKETCRLDPPVTSATTSITQDGSYELAGRNIALKKGTLQQYVISLAMRDEAVFPDPALFEPDRPELGKTITWNGAFTAREGAGWGGADEKAYPRICPGRWLAIDVVTAVLNHAVSPSQ